LFHGGQRLGGARGPTASKKGGVLGEKFQKRTLPENHFTLGSAVAWEKKTWLAKNAAARKSLPQLGGEKKGKKAIGGMNGGVWWEHQAGLSPERNSL